jgi:hypothetical protein
VTIVRRALLIGSAYAGLPVEPSVDSMGAWLLGRGFSVDEIARLSGADATRDNILAGLGRLADVDHGEAPVVVYYAGHGHLYRTDIGAGEGGHAAYPLLVAIDIESSANGVLRSILGSELSRSLQRIARRARNLTVILDCCHASGMVRLDDDTDNEAGRTTERAIGVEASARIERPRSSIMRGASRGAPERLSERVIVVAASSAGGRAYPHPVTERLVFTDALLAALDRHSTWDAVLAETRARVQEVWPIQHPAVFGPRYRRPLTLDEQLPDGELYRVERKGEDHVLMAGTLSDIHPGDRFELTTLASTNYGPTSILGRVQPHKIHPEHTVVRIPIRPLPQPCYARRVERGRCHAVTLACPDPSLRAALADIVVTAKLRVAEDGERDLAARLEVRGGMLHVFDGLGELVHLVPIDPLPADDLRRCLHRLDRWCRVSRWLLGDSSGRPLRRCYELRWGRADDGTKVEPGAVQVRPGDALALTLRNLDRGEPELYAHAFRIRADREIRAWNAGIGAQAFAARERINAGQQRAQGTRAFIIDAPPALPPGVYREWTLVAVSNQTFDVDLIETPLHARALTTGFNRSWGRKMRGAERMFDIVAFPYTIELPADG